jgi:tetratricopeptide (TPR) repeat protein
MVLVYSGALQAGFFLDDTQTILLNPNVTDLGLAFKQCLTSDRGLVNLSLAVNYALTGSVPWGFHFVNLAVHYLNGLLLFALLLTTLRLPRVGLSASRAALLAFYSAAIWLVHPLGSQAVIYVVQRAELMATTMMLLSALMLVLSATSTSRRWLWQLLCVLACFAGMQCKLIALVTPLILLIFDWLFISEKAQDIWRQRRWMYVGSFASWSMMFVFGIFSMFKSDAQLASAGTGLMRAIPPSLYLAAQSQILLYYLYLAIWPGTLVFDHQWPLPIEFWACWPTLLTMTVLFLMTVLLVIRRVRWSLLPALFFLVLAPTSSFMPVIDLAVEHRMYLALSSVCVGVVLLLGWLLREKSRWLVGILVTVLIALSLRTWVRVGDYQDPEVLWGKILATYPQSPRAIWQVKFARLMKNGLEKQINQLYRAIAAKPDDDASLYALGEIYFQLGEFKFARPLLEQAWQRQPDQPDYTKTLAQMLRIDGELDRALELYEKLIKQRPDVIDIRISYAELLAGLRHWDDALAQLDQADAIFPDNPAVYANRANILLRAGRPHQAIEPARQAFALSGSQSNTAGVLASAYAANGMWAEARDLFEQLHQQNPMNPGTIQRLAWLYATCPDPTIQNGQKAMKYARTFFEKIGGESPTTWDTLAAAWARVGQFQQACDAMHKAIDRLKAHNREDLVPAFNQRLELYEQKQPFTQSDPQNN